jgi:hypothetical protein
MSENKHQLIQGAEWLPCCIGAGFNFYRAHQENIKGTASDLTHAQLGWYALYGIYQIGTLVGVLKGLEMVITSWMNNQ